MKKSTLVSTTILSICAVFCSVMLLWIGISAVFVQYEYSCAAEIQRQEDLSLKANFEKKSWDERSQEIKSEFADSSWATRIASGNADKTMSALLLTTLAVGLVASTTGLIFISAIASKKAKAKAKAMAKAKAEAEARARAEAEEAAYKARMQNFLLYNRI